MSTSSQRHMAVVGTFDGVHLGHRYLLDTLCRRAMPPALSPMVVTFPQHPLSVISPGSEPPLLTTPDEKESLLHSAGIDKVVTLRFDDTLRQLSAQRFMTMLRDRYDVSGMLMGFNHRFGSDRSLGFNDYREIGRSIGVDVSLAGEFRPENNAAISSSAIRSMIAAGDLESAAAALGRPYSLSGIVGNGHRIGRTIGFPTANIGDINPSKMIPPSGVYAAIATLDDGSCYQAVVNIGRRPTVDVSADPPVTIEAHLIGFDGDLYGRPLTLSFVKRLRGERRFPSLDELKAQIARDIASL